MYSELYGEYTVNYAGDKAGTLKISQEGLMTVFDCLCACNTSQVLKLTVFSGGSLKILGVMAPEGGKLKFNKKYSKNDLSQISLDSIEDVFLLTDEEAKISSEVHSQKSPEIKAREKNGDEWRTSENPKNLFCDEDLRKSCENITGALEKSIEGGLILLAVPFETGGPFPLMPIFCFGESMNIRGKNYLVFCLKDGNLYF